MPKKDALSCAHAADDELERSSMWPSRRTCQRWVDGRIEDDDEDEVEGKQGRGQQRRRRRRRGAHVKDDEVTTPVVARDKGEVRLGAATAPVCRPSGCLSGRVALSSVGGNYANIERPRDEAGA